MAKKHHLLRSGISYGTKVWLVIALLGPLLFELTQFLRGYNQGGYQLGRLGKFAPIAYLFWILIHLIFFLVPCMISGIVLSLVEGRKMNWVLQISPIFLGLFVTSVGYGSMWIFLFSKVDYMNEYSYWIESLTMFGLQIILWFWTKKRVNLLMPMPE